LLDIWTLTMRPYRTLCFERTDATELGGGSRFTTA